MTLCHRLELAEVYGRLSCPSSESSGLYDASCFLLRTIRSRGCPYCLGCGIDASSSTVAVVVAVTVATAVAVAVAVT
jgi:hypothetical protein